MKCCKSDNNQLNNAPDDCGGGCRSTGCGGCNREDDFNMIVELEIYYKEITKKKNTAYSFEGLSYITNTQQRESIGTGFEGKIFENLDEISDYAISFLVNSEEYKGRMSNDIDVFFIMK
ncbi:MAG: hypothetical protein ACOZCL_02740 [Bacillota bacterium]